MQLTQLLSSTMDKTYNGNVNADENLVAGLESLEAIDNLVDAEKELDKAVAASATIETAVAGLENLEATVEAIQAKGGMDSSSALLLKCSVQNALQPLGIDLVQPVPAQESFEAEGGRAASTTYALEGLTVTIRKMWKSIKAFLVKVRDAVIKWYRENLSQAARLKAAAEKLAEKDLKGTPKEKELSVSRPDYVMDGSKAVGLTVAGLNAVEKMVMDLTKEDISNSSVATLTSAIKDVKMSDDATASTVLTRYNNAISTYNLTIAKGSTEWKAKDKRVSAGDSATVRRLPGGNIPGDMCFVVVKSKDSEGGAESPVRLEFVGPVEAKKDAKAKALVASDIKAVAKAVASVADAILDSKKVFDGVERSSKDLLSLGDDLDVSISDDLSKDNQKAARKMLNGLSTLTKNTTTPNTEAIRALQTTAGAAFSFAKASASNLKEEKKD